MAGLSLRCGDCGALLKSVQEAQEHAELTQHSNFSESTEAVLNLVCTTCSKPCRSRTESDLHTKRTGHADFDDRTLEAAKPIELEASHKAAAESVESAGWILRNSGFRCKQQINSIWDLIVENHYKIWKNKTVVKRDSWESSTAV